MSAHYVTVVYCVGYIICRLHGQYTVIYFKSSFVRHSFAFLYFICKVHKTRCMAMPSLMASRWVDQNSGPIFRRLWTKVHRIKFACERKNGYVWQHTSAENRMKKLTEEHEKSSKFHSLWKVACLGGQPAMAPH